MAGKANITPEQSPDREGKHPQTTPWQERQTLPIDIPLTMLTGKAFTWLPTCFKFCFLSGIISAMLAARPTLLVYIDIVSCDCLIGRPLWFCAVMLQGVPSF